MTIHVVMGPPCSGKSTFVETNAPAGTPRWDFDAVATTVAGDDVAHDIPQPVLDVVLAMRRGLMGYVLDVETTVPELWMIHSSPSPNILQRLAAVQAEFHLIDPGMEECIARAQREGRPPHTEQEIRAWYESPPEIPGEKGGAPMHKTKTKQVTVNVKAGGDDGPGEGMMTAYASVFDTIDSYGDVVRKGAFTDTLTDWKASGNTIPLLYGHDMRDPFSNIGGVTEAVEDDHGLKITAQFDLDNPKAAQVYKLVKEKRLSQMSFAFAIQEAGWAKEGDEEFLELRKLDLFEVSVVPIGANQDTEILDVKTGEKVTGVVVTPEQFERLRQLEAKEATDGGGRDPDPDPSNEPRTPDGTHPAGDSHSKGQANALEARLMLLERTHHV